MPRTRTTTKAEAEPETATAPPLKDTIPPSTRMAYTIGRGEQGVLTFEPYKSHLLPLWRFRTVPLARQSAADLWSRFEQFAEEGDFVGMDMARKFIQMGMTRARRYANHRGGRKYSKDTGEELPRSEGHEGREEKERASEVFREYWVRCREHGEYGRLKGEFIREKKEFDKGKKGV